jgi:hypothetical protein
MVGFSIFPGFPNCHGDIVIGTIHRFEQPAIQVSLLLPYKGYQFIVVNAFCFIQLPDQEIDKSESYIHKNLLFYSEEKKVSREVVMIPYYVIAV